MFNICENLLILYIYTHVYMYIYILFMKFDFTDKVCHSVKSVTKSPQVCILVDWPILPPCQRFSSLIP